MRIEAQTGRVPAHPGLLGQLVSLGAALRLRRAGAASRASGIPALRITTAPDGGTPPGGDELAGLDAGRLTRARPRVGARCSRRSTAAVELPSATDGALYLGDRAVRGWAIELLLLAAVVPFRGRHARPLSPLPPAAAPARSRVARAPPTARRLARRRRRSRPGGASAGALPTGPRLPPPPDQPARRRVAGRAPSRSACWSWRSSGSARGRADPAGARAARGGPRVRTRSRSSRSCSSRPQRRSSRRTPSCSCCPRSTRGCAPPAAASSRLGHRRRLRARAVGPVLALVVLGEQLDLGLRAPLYAASLLTTGVVPWAVHARARGVGRRRRASSARSQPGATRAPSEQVAHRRPRGELARRRAGRGRARRRRRRGRSCATPGPRSARARVPASDVSRRRALEVVAVQGSGAHGAAETPVLEPRRRVASLPAARAAPGSDEQQRADERRDGVPGQAEDERLAAHAERERLARAASRRPRRPPRRRARRASRGRGRAGRPRRRPR